jgi:hypothetical protein
LLGRKRLKENDIQRTQQERSMTKSIVEFMVSPEGRAMVNDAVGRAATANRERGGEVATRVNGKTVIQSVRRGPLAASIEQPVELPVHEGREPG